MSLDAVSEALIRGALETLKRGRTTLVVVHQLATIQKVDHIIDIGRHHESCLRAIRCTPASRR